MQATCSEDACDACGECMMKSSSKIAKCIAKQKEEKGKDCYNPGTTWCPGGMQALWKCQTKSRGCWYKLLCSTKGICKEWKDVWCGGATAEKPLPASFLQTESAVNSSKLSSFTEEKSLDEALSGKRTAGAPCNADDLKKQNTDLFYGYTIIR